MKIFVTGATGFIGKHFLGACIQRGHQVIGHARDEGKTWVDKNITWTFDELFQLSPSVLDGVDTVVHFAATGISPRSCDDSQLQLINVDLADKLLRISKIAGVRRFVAAGSYAEYGWAAKYYEKIPSDSPLMPITPYAISKVKSFNLLLSNAQELDIELYYLRIFSAYGEGQYIENLWPALKKAALSGQDFKLTSGSQVRDFISVSDVANAFANAATVMKPHKNPMVLNVGSGVGVSVRDFATAWWKMYEAKGNLIFDSMPQRSNEADKYTANIAYESELGLFWKC
jgi:nucleoside-diphosphate-sugar epimerase